jgi:hypothetical protein
VQILEKKKRENNKKRKNTENCVGKRVHGWARFIPGLDLGPRKGVARGRVRETHKQKVKKSG